MSPTATPARDAVLGTTELVILILEHVDELSLIRSQGVNHLFHKVISGTKTLRLHIGLICEEDDDAIRCVDVKEHHGVVWNPLLDWFITRTFLMDRSVEGPINQSSDRVHFNVLPHAKAAALNPASSIHKISITNKSVDELEINFLLEDHTMLCSEKGVSIGQVLKAWSKLDGKQQFLPIAIDKTYDLFDNIPRLSFFYRNVTALPWYVGHFTWTLKKTLDRIKPLEEQEDWKDLSWQKKNRCEMVGRFYCVAGSAKWFGSSMKEQSEAMKLLMLELKGFNAGLEEGEKVGHIFGRTDDPMYPLWPALAWDTRKTDEFVHKAPYTVDYAAGLVFNRQD